MLPWANHPQHSTSNCATKQPCVCMKSEERVWQWSDCSLSASNATISNPWVGCAGNKLTLPRSSYSPEAKGKSLLFSKGSTLDTMIVVTRTLSHKTEGSEQDSHSPWLICSCRTQSQQHGSASLLFLQLLAYYSRKTTEVCQEFAVP
jgi:hypothetical protein